MLLRNLINACMMINSHLESIKIVAQGLGELIDEVVFVGGAVSELYASMPESSEIRVTLDVDCVIGVSTVKEYQGLEDVLRSKGFKHDTRKGAPVCRWIYKSVIVDIMPVNEEILGFTNRWYVDGLKRKKVHQLTTGLNINLLQVEYLLASKLEALKNRGGDDLRQSHDFEDIVYLLANDPEILARITIADQAVKDYLIKEFTSLLSKPELKEGIECGLPYGSEGDYTMMILKLIETISELPIGD